MSNMNFNQNLSQLEVIVKQMETSNLNLDEALKHYEQGIKLVRACQTSLEQAEQKIYELSQESTAEKKKINVDDF